MLTKPSDCSHCPLANISRGFLREEGLNSLGVYVMGEAAGDNEATDGLPFRPFAPAGSVLERSFKRLGLDRSQFRIGNIVNCQPPGDKLNGASYEIGAIEHCKVHWEARLKTARPKVILALGNIPLRTLTGMSGKMRTITALRGYVFETPYGLVIPSIHPAFIRRGKPGFTGLFLHDLQKAVYIAKNGYSRPPAPKYDCFPGLDMAESYTRMVEDNPNLMVTYDIETRESFGQEEDELEWEDATEEELDQAEAWEGRNQAIERLGTTMTQIQFSTAPGTGIVFPAEGEYLALSKRIMATQCPKAGQNVYRFDNPILRDRYGFAINGVIHDTRWAWHHLQPDLPANLQCIASVHGFPFPWKHLAQADPGFYGGCDVDAPQRIMSQILISLEKRGVMRGYMEHIVGFDKVLVNMSRRGILQDPEAKEEFRKELVSEMAKVDETLQAKAPEEMRSIHPKEGYKQDKAAERDGAAEHAETTHQGHPAIWTRRQFTLGDALEPETVERWCKILRFNPNSSDQLIRYMKAKGHPVPINRKEQRETTAKKELERLAKKVKDGFYLDVLDYRGLGKMLTTYVDGWVAARDGRVHSEFGYGPATGQLNSRGPNVQNCFSGDTEVLTRRGWVRFDLLLDTDLVAQYGTDTGRVDFVLPIQVIRQKYDGPMLHITTDKQIDLLVTPDHECLLRTRKRTPQWKRVKAADYPEDHLQYEAGWYADGSVYRSPSEIVVMAALQADGHILTNCNNAVDFVLTKPRKRARLQNALDDLKIPYRVSPKGDGTRFYIGAGVLPKWMIEAKFLGPWVLDLCRESFQRLAEEIWFWDGCAERRSMYSSSVRSNADWGQILTILVGRRGRLRKYHNGNPNSAANWQVDATNNSYSLTTGREIETVLGDGMVYCVTMPKGTVIVRRNGRVAITGNCPKHRRSTEEDGKPGLADRFRMTIIPQKGHRLVEADFRSFHACTLALETGDASYDRMARIDMHSFFAACGVLRIARPELLMDMPNEELKAYFDALKVDKKKVYAAGPVSQPFKWIRDKLAKPCILGYGFGMQGGTLYEMNQEFMPSKNFAQGLIDTLDQLYPITSDWRRNICLDVHDGGNRTNRELGGTRNMLVSRHGYLRWFWEVFRWDSKRRCLTSGDDHERVIAFLPANDAFGHYRDALNRLESIGANDDHRLINNLHDAGLYEVRDDRLEEGIAVIKQEMEKASTVLFHPKLCPGGFQVGVDVQVSATRENGGNWCKKAPWNPGGMEDWKAA